MEVTILSKPSMSKGRLATQRAAGRNVSERRAGLEKGNVEADPPEKTGKAAAARTSALAVKGEARAIRLTGPTGVVATAC